MFIENKGQWNDQALFFASIPGMRYWITRDGMVFDQFRTGWQGGERYTEGQVVRMSFEGGAAVTGAGGGLLPARFDYLVGAPSTHRKGVRGFQEAYQQSVYPGITARHYFENELPRYDLQVSPGADPSVVRFRFKGADGLELASNGDLIIKTRVGNLRHGGIFAYQNEGETLHKVAAKFVILSRDRVGIQLGAFDRNLPLVIDPLVYGTHFGGDAIPMQASDDRVFNIRSGRDGGVYVVGATRSGLFPITDGYYGRVAIGSTTGNDAFMSKFSGDAFQLLYSVFVGGTSDDIGRGVAVDPSGDFVWLCGTTTSTDLPGINDPGNAFSSMFATRQGTRDLFFVRFRTDPERQLIPDYVTYYGAAARTITFGGFHVGQVTGNLVVAGTIGGGGLPGTFNNAYQGGSSDGFLIYFNSTGTAVNVGTYIGGNGEDNLGDLALDSNDYAVTTGTVVHTTNEDTSVTNPPRFVTTPGVFPGGRLLRRTDAFVRKYDPAGNIVFSALLGGNGDDSNRPGAGANPVPVFAAEINTVARCAVDQDNNIYIASIARSFDYPRTIGVFGETFSAAPVVTVTKISSSGAQIMYSTHLRTTGRIYPNAIAVDHRGFAIVGGVASWDQPPFPGFPTTPASIPTTEDGIDRDYEGGDRTWPPPMGEPLSSVEGFICYLNSNATNLVYSSYIGGAGDDEILGIGVDQFNSAWFSGHTQDSSGAPSNPIGLPAGYLSNNALKRVVDGGGDGFFIKMRVQLPILDAVVVQTDRIGGGLAQSSLVGVFLRAPAPSGGLTVQVHSNTPTVASFDANAPVGTTNVSIPAGQQLGITTIYSRPVGSEVPVTITGVLDNEFRSTILWVAPWLTSLTLSQSSVVGGNNVNGRITLFGPAPSGGITIDVRTTRPDVVTVPSSVQIAVNEIGADFVVQTKGVVVPTLARITAQFENAVRSANLVIVPPNLKQVIFTPNPVTRGERTTMRVELDGSPSSPAVIDVVQTVGHALIGLPAQVTIPANSTFVEVELRAPFVPETSVAIVRATWQGREVSGTLIIDASIPDPVITLTLTPAAVVGGTQTSVATVRLSIPAPPGGITLFPASRNTEFAQTPSILFMPHGSSEATFVVTTSRAPADTDVGIQVSTSDSNNYDVKTLTVLRCKPVQMILSPDTVTGGQSSTGRVNLNGPAPEPGVTLIMDSTNSAAQVPATVFIPPFQSFGTFTITTNPVINDVTANIVARYGNDMVQAPLRIVPPRLQSLTFNPSQVRGEQTSIGTVTLDQPAPPNQDIVVTLESTNTGVVTVPASVTIQRGTRTATFIANTKKVSRGITVEVFARRGSQQVSGYLSVIP